MINVDDERCQNCKHCHQSKKLVSTYINNGAWLKKREWKEEYICTIWLDEGYTHEPLLLTLDGIDRPCNRCEMWEETEQIKEQCGLCARLGNGDTECDNCSEWDALTEQCNISSCIKTEEQKND